jgi:hypothetical protein
MALMKGKGGDDVSWVDMNYDIPPLSKDGQF